MILNADKVLSTDRGRVGRPAEDRQAIAAAFIAKAVFHVPTTKGTIELLQSGPALRRICGWESGAAIPHESVFCRAFAEFARTELPQRLHEALIEATQKERLIGHISRDATAIAARPDSCLLEMNAQRVLKLPALVGLRRHLPEQRVVDAYGRSPPHDFVQ